MTLLLIGQRDYPICLEIDMDAIEGKKIYDQKILIIDKKLYGVCMQKWTSLRKTKDA